MTGCRNVLACAPGAWSMARRLARAGPAALLLATLVSCWQPEGHNCSLSSTGCAVWSCSDSVDFEGTVPVPFEELAAGSVTWCVETVCETVRVVQPVPPDPALYTSYRMFPYGVAQHVGSASTRLDIKVTIEAASDREWVSLTVNDADGGVLFELARFIDYQGFTAEDGKKCRWGSVRLDEPA